MTPPVVSTKWIQRDKGINRIWPLAAGGIIHFDGSITKHDRHSPLSGGGDGSQFYFLSSQTTIEQHRSLPPKKQNKKNWSGLLCLLSFSFEIMGCRHHRAILVHCVIAHSNIAEKFSVNKDKSAVLDVLGCLAGCVVILGEISSWNVPCCLLLNHYAHVNPSDPLTFALFPTWIYCQLYLAWTSAKTSFTSEEAVLKATFVLKWC